MSGIKKGYYSKLELVFTKEGRDYILTEKIYYRGHRNSVIHIGSIKSRKLSDIALEAYRSGYMIAANKMMGGYLESRTENVDETTRKRLERLIDRLVEQQKIRESFTDNLFLLNRERFGLEDN